MLHVAMEHKLDHDPIAHMHLKYAMKNRIVILENVRGGEIGDPGEFAQELINAYIQFCSIIAMNYFVAIKVTIIII